MPSLYLDVEKSSPLNSSHLKLADKGRAKYWKIGKLAILVDGKTLEYATSVFLCGTYVFTCGKAFVSATCVGKYWKNSSAIILTGVAVTTNLIFVVQ